MTRVTRIDPASATGRAAERPAQIKSAVGMVPNVFKAAA